MKVTFTQKEINEFVTKHLGLSIEIDVEISNDAVVNPPVDGWIKNTQTIPLHPKEVTGVTQIVTSWSDGDVLTGRADGWDSGWHINNDSVHITHYNIID